MIVWGRTGAFGPPASAAKRGNTLKQCKSQESVFAQQYFTALRELGFALSFFHTKQQLCLNNEMLFFPQTIVVVSLRISAQLGTVRVWDWVSAWRAGKKQKAVQDTDNDGTRRHCVCMGRRTEVCACTFTPYAAAVSHRLNFCCSSFVV